MSEKLSKKIFFAYGFQEFALGFLTTMGVQYISFFLTDAALIAPAVVATILLIGRIVDTVDVPIIGMVVEKINFKKRGKYRTWLYMAAPMVVVFNMLMFTNFNVSTPVKVAYLSAAYILAYIFVNFCSTARFALLPTFTSDQNERAILAARRGQGSSLSQIVRGAITVPLVALLGAGSATKGYFYVVIIYGVLVILGLYWIAGLAKPYDLPGTAETKKSPSVKEMLTQVATNKPLLILLVSNIILLTATNILTGFGMYYFRYVVGNLMLFSLYLPITFGGGFLGNSVAQFISTKYDKKVTYNIGVGFWFLGMLLVYLFAGNNASLFIAFVTVAQFGAGMSNATVPAFFSDTADYGEWKTGKSSRAVNMALVIFPIKIGVLLGGAVATYGLSYIGFVANTKDPAVIDGIRTLATVAPMIVSIFAAVVMHFYPLTKNKMGSIQLELKNKSTLTR